MHTPPLSLIAETARFVLFSKPALSHSTLGGKHTTDENKLNSIAYAVGLNLPQYASSSPNPSDNGLVNRLDFETSGLMVLAKSRDAWEELHGLFTNGRVKKSYLCLMEGEVKEEIVEGYIYSSSRSSKKVRVSTRELRDSQYSRTIYRPICYIPSLDATAAEAHTGTGRRHQVRAHAAFAGHPLVGDTLYGAKTKLPPMLPPFFLHSSTFHAKLSIEGEVRWHAPPPSYYLELLEQCASE